MLYILVGEKKDDRMVSGAAEKGTLLEWRVPKEAHVGDKALIYLSSLGFKARCVIASEPHKKRFYSAEIGNVRLFPFTVLLAFIRDKHPRWKWPNYPRTYTIVRGAIEKRLINLLECYRPPVLTEGTPDSIRVTRYERNPRARHECIGYYGDSCFVCGFSFGKTYGESAQGFIHVHHLRKVASNKERYRVDPVKDMRPVCPNCHAMIHRRKTPLNINKLKNMLTVAPKETKKGIREV